MMKRVRIPARELRSSFEPQPSQFAVRPFAQRAEEPQAPKGESRVSFSLADIDIFSRETVQPKLRLGPVGDRYEQEADRVARRVVQTISSPDHGPVQRQEDLIKAKEEAPPNRTGMPDIMKSGLENLTGMDLSRVRVHYNSSKPAQLNALAYTQGQEIHVAPGQERHLAHEGWHVVQQAQGRVKPTMQAKGVSINDEAALEREADLKGAKASTQNNPDPFSTSQTGAMGEKRHPNGNEKTIQLLTAAEIFSIPKDKMDFVRKTFKEDADSILKLAPDIKTLRDWTLQMNALNVAVKKAEEKVENPKPSGPTREERQELKDAKAVRVQKLNEILHYIPVTKAPVWGASSSFKAASTSLIPPSTVMAPSAPVTLPDVTSVTTDYNSHGDYTPSSGNAVKQSQLVSYVKENHNHFYHRKAVSGGEGYQMYLGDIEMEQWYITVTLKADGSAVITHFGPFGISTSTSIESQSQS